MFKPRWYLLLTLIGFATLVRLFPYIWMQFNIEVSPRYSMFLPWNFAPLMAITLFAGAHFRNSGWAFLIPLTVLAASDLGIYLITGHADWALYPNQPPVISVTFRLLCVSRNISGLAVIVAALRLVDTDPDTLSSMMKISTGMELSIA